MSRKAAGMAAKHEITLFPPPDSVVGQRYYYVTQRPWPSLLFVLPMLIVFEAGSYLCDGGRDPSTQLVATFLIDKMTKFFGASGFFFPAMATVAILLAIHIVGKHPWRFDIYVLPGMLGESIIWVVPLLVLDRLLQQAVLAARLAAQDAWLSEMVWSFGAGLYEELVFRLICITIMVIVLIDILKLPRKPSALFIMLSSAVLFAAQHHPPLGVEPFQTDKFLFRTIAGIYLASLYIFRGFGIAAGCHSFYNVIVVTIRAVGGG
ncbi:MAG: CPBP family intramembrane metalloprotease [Phycisphaerales bacterium]|nr:CPBP family intramembrane metalloprotease [Phycisphaerales bacterium]